jgi:hypothetical protein
MIEPLKLRLLHACGPDVAAPELLVKIKEALQLYESACCAALKQGFEFRTTGHLELESPLTIMMALQQHGDVWITTPEPVPNYQGILTTKDKVP